MPDLLVRGVDEAIVKALKERAGAHGRSAEAEHRVILAEALARPRKLRPGTRVVAQPMLRSGDVIGLVGLSTTATGAYAERMLLQEALLVPVPNGLPSTLVALNEPMAVGWHVVRRSDVTRKDHTPLEFRDTLHMIAEGKVNCAPLVTGQVGLDGVDRAFTALEDPETHAKFLIDPTIAGDEIRTGTIVP